METIQNVYPINHTNIDDVAQAQEGVDYSDWQKAMLFVSIGTKVAKLVGWVKKVALPAEVEISRDLYEMDNGVCAVARHFTNDLGIRTVKYIKSFHLDMVVTPLGFKVIEGVKGLGEAFYDLPDFKAGAAIVFWTGECYQYLFKAIMPRLKDATVKFTSREGEFNMTAYLVPFGILANFQHCMNRYAEDPDRQGTEFEEFTLVKYEKAKRDNNEYSVEQVADFDTRNLVINSAAEGLGTINAEQITTTKDIAYAFAYTHLFLMVKSGQSDYVKPALTKRLSAMKNALKCEELNVEEFIRKRIVTEEYQKAYERLSFYPKLKSAIFSCVLSHEDAFNSHIKGILKEAQFTVYNLMVAFVYSAELTTLHVVDEVMADYGAFAESYAALKQRYGDNWAYCKLIHPDETLGTLSKFPNLQHAAKAYAFANKKGESLANLKGMNQIPNYYFYYATQKLSETTVRGVRDAQTVRNLLKLIREDDQIKDITDDILKDARTRAHACLKDNRIDPFVSNFMKKN